MADTNGVLLTIVLTLLAILIVLLIIMRPQNIKIILGVAEQSIFAGIRQ